MSNKTHEGAPRPEEAAGAPDPRKEPSAAPGTEPGTPQAEPAPREAEAPAPETEAPGSQPEAAPGPEEELEALRAELAGEKDKYLRLMAEYDNFRKRSARERECLYADVKADLLEKLLPVYDNLARALQQQTADEAYRRGVEMTMNQFMEILEKVGVTPIPAVGVPFDPAVHNAVMHIQDEEHGEGEIVQEYLRGFKMGDRVIRHSMVQVAN